MRRVACVFVSLMLGCAGGVGPGDNPVELVDRAGYGFGWMCEDDRCHLGDVPFVDRAPPCADAQWSLAWGRFFELCVVCPFPGGWSSDSYLCRPAACETDADCPQLYGVLGDSRFECASGLCQSTDLAVHPRDVLDRYDAELLCFADVAREVTMSSDDPIVVERTTLLDESCPWEADTCELPSVCLAP